MHAPLPLLLLALVGFLGRGHAWGRRLVWFAIGCAGHTAIDIVSHADDGPVLLFPLDWHKRYHAPISYWDEARGGRLFTLLEHLLDILLALYLLGERRRKPRINTD